MIRAGAAALLLVLFAGEAAPADEPDFARVKAELAEAREALVAASAKRARLSALGKAVQAHERALILFRQGLRQLAIREAQLKADLAADQAQLSDLLGALQSLSRAPRSALLTYPGGPVNAARSAALMSGISPELQARVAALRSRLDKLAQIRTAQQVARVEARGALAALQDLRSETAAALRSRRTGSIASRAELQAQADSVAKRARDLDQLARILKPSHIPAERPFADARGTLPPPVAGTLVGAFGAPDSDGRPLNGLTVSAPAFAEVSAPWSGTIRFAGPLTDYGYVIILEPQNGWLIVMAGLSTVDREVGEVVLAGERLGSLGGPLPSSDEFLLEAATVDAQFPEKMLYLEMRDGDSAVDPAIWFDLTDKRTER